MKKRSLISMLMPAARAVGAGCGCAMRAASDLGSASLPVARDALRGAAGRLRGLCSFEEREGISRHVRLAGFVACAVSAAQCFAPPGPGLLVKIGGAVVIAGIAISAALRIEHQHRASSPRFHGRGLLRLTARHIAARHDVWAALALSVACDPPDLRADHVRRRVVDRVRRGALGSLVRPAASLLPVVGVALNVAEAYATKARSEHFVRDVETTASALCMSVAFAVPELSG